MLIINKNQKYYILNLLIKHFLTKIVVNFLKIIKYFENYL